MGRHIANYVEEHKLGYVTAAETGYILKKNPKGRDTVRGLDVGYVSQERAPKGLPDKHIPFAPDLAVEVISPRNSAEDIHNKIIELFDAGAKLVWIVYPSSQTIVVHTGDSSTTLRIDDTLSGGDVLSGFELPVREIFAD
ncbi:MAG: Uma2 family endonuclease [Anaerolineae bacterium]|nr:Uma2 family endonuclease [Anaerolineae bacterium]